MSATVNHTKHIDPETGNTFETFKFSRAGIRFSVQVSNFDDGVTETNVQIIAVDGSVESDETFSGYGDTSVRAARDFVDRCINPGPAYGTPEWEAEVEGLEIAQAEAELRQGWRF